jgi:hypothetical protein
VWSICKVNGERYHKVFFHFVLNTKKKKQRKKNKEKRIKKVFNLIL